MAATRGTGVVALLVVTIAVIALAAPALARASNFYGLSTTDNYSDGSAGADLSNCWVLDMTSAPCGQTFPGTASTKFRTFAPWNTVSCWLRGIPSASCGEVFPGIKWTKFRIFVPWDVVETAQPQFQYSNPTAVGTAGCRWSSLAYTGWWSGLVNEVNTAESKGLQPLLVISDASTGADGGLPTNGTSVPDDRGGSPSYIPSDMDYYCGVAGIMDGLRNSPGLAIETYNEPDCWHSATWKFAKCDAAPNSDGADLNYGHNEFDNDSMNAYGHTCGDCGKYAAADLYYDAWLARASVNTSYEWIVAGALSQYSLQDTTVNGNGHFDGFMNQYIAQIADWHNAGVTWPERWSGHNYDDVDLGASWDTDNLEARDLVKFVHAWDPGSWVWLTESADNLVEQHTDAQRSAAAGDFLVEVSGGGNPTLSVPYVEGAFWYEAQDLGNPGWDSALEDDPPGYVAPPGWVARLQDDYPRANYCRLSGYTGCS